MCVYRIAFVGGHTFNDPLSRTTRVSRYQKGKTNLDFTEARDSEWQWHQLGHMQVCISLQTENHASTPPLSFLQVGCPSCRPTNSVKALLVDVKVIFLWRFNSLTTTDYVHSSPPRRRMFSTLLSSCHFSWIYLFGKTEEVAPFRMRLGVSDVWLSC